MRFADKKHRLRVHIEKWYCRNRDKITGVLMVTVAIVAFSLFGYWFYTTIILR